MMLMNKLLIGFLAGMFVLMAVDEAMALNVTDNLDMNNGTILNVSQIDMTQAGVFTTNGIKASGELNTAVWMNLDFIGNVPLALPFFFSVDYKGNGSASYLATEGTVKSSNGASRFTGYGDRRNLGAGLGTSMTGSRNYYSKYTIWNPPQLSGGSWEAYEVYHPTYGLVQFSGGLSPALDVGYYTEASTVALALGSGINLDAYGFECGEYSNLTGGRNNSWCFYSPSVNNYHLMKGTLILGNLSNISDTVQTSDLIDLVLNPVIDTDTQHDTSGEYLYNDTTTNYFNETKLNETIDDRAGDSFVYSDHFNQGLNTSNQVEHGNVTTDWLISSDSSETYIDLNDDGDFCMYFVVETGTPLVLCEDEIQLGDSINPQTNVTNSVGDHANNWYAEGAISELYYNNIYAKGQQGITYEANLTDSAGDSCGMNFTKGILTASNCSGGGPGPSPAATSPFPLGIDEEDDPKSRLPIVFVP